MTTCSTNTCGVGGWNGPQPGDPSFGMSVSASRAFGGIDISWSYPVQNPFAVSFFVVYRGLDSNFANSIEVARVAGSMYYDKNSTNAITEYFYWVKFVSIHGTESPLFGPASAESHPTYEQVIAEITGRIDSGVLAQSLQTEINKITLNYSELALEIQNRISANQAYGLALNQLGTDLNESLTLLATEITERRDGESALVVQANLAAAANQENSAAILAIDTLKLGYSALASNGAPYDGDGQTVVYPEVLFPASLYPQYVGNRTTIIDATGVLIWNGIAANSSNQLIWQRGMPLASAIKTVQITGPDGNSASVQQAFSAQKDLNDEFKATYTAKVNANGLVGGFGIYNDGETVEAGFDVDKFWVGRTDEDKTKPFIIEDGVVYINTAIVANLDASVITTGKITADRIDGKGLSIQTASGGVLLSTDGYLGSSLRIGGPEGSTLETIATNAAIANLNFIGAYEEPPSIEGLLENSVYKNTVSGHSFILSGTPLAWQLYLENAIDYDVEIESSNGTNFRIGQGRTTRLIARVYRNGVEITESIPAANFKWTRVSLDPREAPYDDATWNNLYLSGYKQIDISVDDVYAKATFHCHVFN